MIVKRTLERKTVGDTDVGKVLKERIADLEALLDKLRMIDGVKGLEVLGQV